MVAGITQIYSALNYGILRSDAQKLEDRGGTVIMALCYKSEGCWFDPNWCHWNFSLT